MARDEEFNPRLGKAPRSSERTRTRSTSRSSFLREIQNAVAKAGGLPKKRTHRFTGARLGRGNAVGSVLSSRGESSSLRSRHVIIKGRLIRFKGADLSAAKAHLRYLQRDGVTREGAPGDLYDAQHDKADGRALLERSVGDRHQFRFIVSAEDGIEYPDLKPLTRRLMAQMEKDLGTCLEWVAVDHYNTGHPHTHILLRGKDELGKDLVIVPQYLSHGMRERAAELVTVDLGPRSDAEIGARLRAEMEKERFTSLDRSLIQEVQDGIVRLGQDTNTFQQTIRAGRLQKLKRLGLAEEVKPSQWRLAPDLEPVLRRMGERGDIIKTMHREMARNGVSRNAADLMIDDAAWGKSAPVIGKVLGRGLSDELGDRHYLIVDGVDGRVHYTDIGKGDDTTLLPEGSIVCVTPRRAEIRPADRIVAEVAQANGGRYSVDLHLKHDATATADYAEALTRRLDAMRRAGMGPERKSDGTWTVAPDHLEKALKYEEQQNRSAPVRIEMLSALSTERQVHANGATWLDRELVAEAPAALRDGGFGREVRTTLAQRRQWLVEQGLAEQQPAGIVYRADLTAILRQRELQRVGAQLSKELGLNHQQVADGSRIEGIYRKHLDLVSGRFAIIQSAREFVLVPWRPVLERSLGKSVSGIAGDAISWSLGRQRGGPSAS